MNPLEPDYEDFSSADHMRDLVEANDIRIEEELIRQRIEVWPYDEWQQWVASHEHGRRSILCTLKSMKASPFCALGYH